MNQNHLPTLKQSCTNNIITLIKQLPPLLQEEIIQQSKYWAEKVENHYILNRLEKL